MSETTSETLFGDDARTRRRERRLHAQFLPKLRRVLARVPFAEDLLAAYYAVLDRRTPMAVRVTLIGALAYFVMPFDVVPDFILGLGFTDDAAVLYAALRSVAGAIEERHREAARRWLDEVAAEG
ncbi:YkvA family protein [Labrys wisconsinensis]|uniref:Uncharacterized membrane protein YkvA (DUF1232 family) n=1 Tax=Labrys wisconsinensis TaxID=425677 RepID=A0ABU0J3M2_9HYPH|nr:YkvA family protein [Labrys wisconsinensis]MDQ0468210.1 uncharacterized membrane protein YkvA (DUF1232 family) [Labrys wisconsinensis]